MQLPDDGSFRTFESKGVAQVVEDDEISEDDPCNGTGEFLIDPKRGNDGGANHDTAVQNTQVKKTVAYLFFICTRFVNLVAIVVKLIQWFIRLIMILAVCICIAVLTHHIAREPELKLEPREDLQTFVVAKSTQLADVTSSIDNIQTASFQTYAGTYCMAGATLERARAAVMNGLADVPINVREEIVNRALQEGITAQNSWMDSQADLDVASKAHFYMGFYSTVHKQLSDGNEVYETCVSVSGMTFTVAETVVDYEVTEEEHQVGMNIKCDPGLFWSNCYKEPRNSTRKTTKPIFKRRVLSLSEQKQLKDWMASQAVESAKSVIGVVEQSAHQNFLSDGAEQPKSQGRKPLTYTAEL